MSYGVVVAVLVHYVRHRLLAVFGENVDLLGEVKRYRSTAFSVREPQRVLVIAARWHNCNSTSVMPLPVQFMQSQQQTCCIRTQTTTVSIACQLVTYQSS